MKDHAKGQKIRILYSLNDFQIALSAADFLSECDPDHKYSKIDLRRYRCYETTMIIAYSRPFSQSKGSVPKLSLKQVGVQLSQNEKSLHKEILKLRNKTVAHSDAEMMRMLSKPFQIQVSDKTITFPHVVFDEGLTFIGDRSVQIIELIRKMIGALAKKIFDAINIEKDNYEIKIDYLDKNT